MSTISKLNTSAHIIGGTGVILIIGSIATGLGLLLSAKITGIAFVIIMGSSIGGTALLASTWFAIKYYKNHLEEEERKRFLQNINSDT